MKNLLIAILSVVILGFIISCGSTKNFPTRFWEKLTSTPEKIIDSIRKADTLFQIPINYVESWNRSMYITSDSVMTTQYVAVTSKKDTVCVISITSTEGDSISLIKYRKE